MKFFCLLPEDACAYQGGIFLCEFFWLFVLGACHAPCKILVPQPGIESMSLLWKRRTSQLPDHQEVPNVYVLLLTYLARSSCSSSPSCHDPSLWRQLRQWAPIPQNTPPNSFSSVNLFRLPKGDSTTGFLPDVLSVLSPSPPAPMGIPWFSVSATLTVV